MSASRYSSFNKQAWLLENQTAPGQDRWGDKVEDFDPAMTSLDSAPVILGFGCDDPRRAGSSLGPECLRRALSQLSWLPIDYLGATLDTRLLDAGTITSEPGDLSTAHALCAQKQLSILAAQGMVLGLGGSSEITWASFKALQEFAATKKIGFLSLGADLQLSAPSGVFYRIAQALNEQSQAFHYFCLGVNPSENTRQQFDFGAQQDVYWRGDIDCNELDMPAIDMALRDFLSELDYLHLQINTSAISAAFAPAANKPASLGLSPHFVLRLLYLLRTLCDECETKLMLVDVVGFNPNYDVDHRTENLLARLLQALVE